MADDDDKIGVSPEGMRRLREAADEPCTLKPIWRPIVVSPEVYRKLRKMAFRRPTDTKDET